MIAPLKRGWATGVSSLLLALISTTPAVGATIHGVQELSSSTEAIAPPVSSVQAIAYLSEQREANGIPGNIVDDAELSQGCHDYTNLYVPAPGQYPHTELPSQPGYTQAGQYAASESDLGVLSGGRDYEWWGPESNPWLEAPLHLARLMNPEITTAWYGQSRHAVCMGTGGFRLPGQLFYSLPGNGAHNVAVSENAHEAPFTPGQAVGIPPGKTTGPYIYLWPETADEALTSTVLVGPHGERVPVKTVTPNTPAPAPSPPFPRVSTVGAYGIQSYVIPTVALKANSQYELRATWTDGAGADYDQVVSFTTGRLTESGFGRHAPAPTGSVRFTIAGRTVQLTAAGVAVGRSLWVTVRRCHHKRLGSTTVEECPASHRGPLFRSAVKLTAGPESVRLPARSHHLETVLTFSMAPFSVKLANQRFRFSAVVFEGAVMR